MSRFAAFAADEQDMIARALGEYLQGRWGDSGRFLDSDDDGWREPARLFVEAAGAGETIDPYMRELLDKCRAVTKR